jgi:ribonuclease D
MWPSYYTRYLGMHNRDVPLPDLREHRLLSLDTETTGLDPREAKVVLVTIATPDTAYVIQADRPGLGEWLADLFLTNTLSWLLHCAPFDAGMLYSAYSAFLPAHRVYDTRLAERQHLTASVLPGSASLGPQVERYLGHTLNKDLATTFQKLPRWERPSDAQLAYAADDALVLFPLALQHLFHHRHAPDQRRLVKDFEAMFDYVDGHRTNPPDYR